MDKDQIVYKIKQLKAMKNFEAEQNEDGKFGAHLYHWSGVAKAINIDEEAIQSLIESYEKRLRGS